jgi:mycothiol synthase
MPVATIRPFGPADLAPVVALWNRCLSKDPITEERFWQLFLLDCNFDPAGALVAEVEGQLVGFLHAIVRKFPMGSLGLEPAKGWITVFFVDPPFRRNGIGSALMEAGLEFLRARGRTEVWCNGYAPYYVFPGIDEDYSEALAFIEAKGFGKLSSPVAMGMRLEGVRMPDKVRERYAELQREGYEVRMFRREDTLPLLDFMEKHFPHWTPSVLDGLQHGNLEIMLATQGGEVVGFTQWENTYNDPPRGAQGRFGPFGVRPDLRSKGIGAVIFYSLIERVAGNGARYLWFGWAGGRNLSFYERAGCVITRQFHLFRRAL